jgi:DNA-binding NtrC family response regulator
VTDATTMFRDDRKGQPCSGLSAEPARPLLLSDQDRASLAVIAGCLIGREAEVAARWEGLYAGEFGPAAYFPPEEFRAQAESEVRKILGALLTGQLSSLATWFRQRGCDLHDAAVPFEEISRSIQMFESSVLACLDDRCRARDDLLGLVGALSRLNQERLILLIETYHLRCKWRWERREAKVLCSLARREGDAGNRDRLGPLVGESAPMQRLYEQIHLAATGRDTVLLVGETGTGKDLAARTIHSISGDPAGTFVPVNCAAMSRELLESELFGHRRGAFSGATGDHQGLFRAAEGGTLFLDEITELPPASQAKLLRALQERAVRPVGGLSEVPVQVRVVASTNEDLRRALEDGKVRRDLYYRLQQFLIALPPLRARKEDIPRLTAHFAALAAKDGACPEEPAFLPGALDRLAAHDWPGNVRELANVVRRACRAAGGVPVEAAHIRFEDAAVPAPPGRDIRCDPSPITLESAERQAIENALVATRGNKSQAAGLLGISRKQLYVKIRKYDL